MKNISDKTFEFLDRYNLEIKDFSFGSSGVIGYLVEKIGEAKAYEPQARALKAQKEKSSWYTKNSSKKNIIDKALDDGLADLLDNAITLWEEERESYNTAISLFKTIHVIGIFNDFEASMCLMVELK